MGRFARGATSHICNGTLRHPAAPSVSPAAYTCFSPQVRPAQTMRFRHLILWILLALLPLRGWATNDMQLSMALGTLTDTVVAATAAVTSTHPVPEAQHHAAPPCHGNAATTGAEAAPESSSGSHAACTLCDLCHSVAMAAAESVLDTLPTVATERVSLVSTDTGHLLIARLDRPPRSALPV